MKIIRSITALLFCLVASVAPLTLENEIATVQAAQAASLSFVEEESLIFMREEEKLARDVYILMFDEWDNLVFYNISTSEQRHMDTLEKMVQKYSLWDPVVDDTPGVFTSTVLDTLYQELIQSGLQGPVDALFVGALIEEKDIRDIQATLEECTHSDLIRAYENLMRGSRNHLRAFVGQIENLGLVYEAKILEQSVVDEIVNSPVERGVQNMGDVGRKGPGR